MNPRANAILCTAADSASLSRISTFSASSFAGRFASLLFGAFLLSGCGSLISPPEPDDAGPGPVTACQADSECGDDQRCDLENFCDSDPSCVEGEPCDAVCFGRCIDNTASTDCFDDSDCGDDQYCEFSNAFAENPAAIMAVSGECVDKPTTTGCYSDLGCENGDVCDTLNYCDAPPGCGPGMDCPAVCYGRCVAPIEGCYGDEDCQDGEFCRFSNAMPAAPGEDGAAFFQEEGVCVADDCAIMDIALPACPPNTIPVSVGGEGCGEVICQPIDDCSGLDPFTCEEVPGCRTENLPMPCDCPIEDPNTDPVPCLCDEPGETICVPDHSCGGLNEFECEDNPDCEGYFFDVGYDCTPDEGENCAQAEPGFICTERTQRDGCRDSRDCFGDERCEVFTICTDECIPGPNGDVTNCLSECWEVGECVVTDTSCYDLAEWECVEDSRCQLTDWAARPEPAPEPCPDTDPNCSSTSDPVAPAPPPQCEPRPNPSCLDDNECGPGQYCELEEWCPPCNIDDPDFACLAPCWIEGVCVDGREPPRGCGDNNTCADNEECQIIEVCEGGCGSIPPPDGTGDPLPPDCTSVCYEEALCVPTTLPEICYFDGDCGLGFECIVDYDTCGATPNGLIACPGTCNQVNPDDQYCVENADCRDGQRCATELEVCYVPPGGPYDVCYSLCVDGDPVEPPANVCLEDADCAATERCATELDVCVCDPNDAACTTCYSSCVPLEIVDPPVCADVIVWASETRDGECLEFATPCDVPAGWFECASATTNDGGTDPNAP